jgi:exodeoxyribonuclease VII small subunit
MAAKSANDDGVRFEDALGDLEETVRRLESGELSLEDSLAAFERGVALVRVLNERLAGVEQRVEVLLRDQEGALRTRRLEPESE